VGLLTQRLAELFRKIWSFKSFKSHVSPHEVMQAITLASNSKFKIIEQSDSINFLSWLLNTLHDYFVKKYKKRQTIISKTFQGELLIETFTQIKESDTYEGKQVVEMDGFRYFYEQKIQHF
jgi:U4/U6.U5 tri-snRNP-associated protein 2